MKKSVCVFVFVIDVSVAKTNQLNGFHTSSIIKQQATQIAFRKNKKDTEVKSFKPMQIFANFIYVSFT